MTKNPPALGPNVPAEKLAANRTPDLFTRRTRLEEGGKGARRDWKGEAERLARELHECRRVGASEARALVEATPVHAPPPMLPEGYGTTDEKGQATMFKRNGRTAFDEGMGYEVAGMNLVRAHLYGGKPISARAKAKGIALLQLAHAAYSRDEYLTGRDAGLLDVDSYRARHRDRVRVGVELRDLGAPTEAPAVEPKKPRAPRAKKTADEKRHATPRSYVGPMTPAEILRWVDAGPAHSRATADAGTGQLEGLRKLEEQGLIRRMPARGRWPDRYVVTVNGSHELGAFRSDDPSFREDAREAGRKARASRPVPRLAATVETKGKHAGQLRLFNPGDPPLGVLTELGLLTEIGYGPYVLCWNLRDAPVLAYDRRGRLYIVYGAGKVTRPSSRDELKAYARTHWGAKGRGDVRNGGRAVGPFKPLGEGTTIQYTTRKGADRQLVNYVHEWGEGGPRKFTAPTVVAHDCKGTTRGPACNKGCGARGAIALAGGTYKVTERGIVG